MGSRSAQGKELIKNVRSAGDWQPSFLVEGAVTRGRRQPRSGGEVGTKETH